MKHKFERYCKDYKNIENYDKAAADNFKGWCCHHRKGVDIPTEELQALGMYYDIPADELIFLTRSEHRALHNKGKHHSEETKKKLSKPKSEKAKKKMSEAWDYDKHFTVETRKKLSEAQTGRHWYNNGEKEAFSKECPEGFVPGRL